MWCRQRAADERRQRLVDDLWVRASTPALRGESFVPPAHPDLGHILDDPRKHRGKTVAGASVSKSTKGTRYSSKRGSRPPT